MTQVNHGPLLRKLALVIIVMFGFAFALVPLYDVFCQVTGLNGKTVTIIRQAGETGQLYGSVSTRDVAALLTEGGFTVDRNQIQLQLPIKTIGLHTVPVALHPEVEVTITINVARNADEAERQARGENVTQRREETDQEAAAADAAAFFEKPEAAADDQGTGEEAKTD